ncbi:putative sfrs protein kinase 3 protein [Eutypa lata UCREL1]|uniref:non-specific serine/threonine protein kinase n=1 Tax=Eutypa lata (strain UCR-EL1) TaxID=1287681 RepID=M7T4F6_EUTLA|nr:putative sfrs protein kinase 3 protein [Eutypa lata UCREL1]
MSDYAAKVFGFATFGRIYGTLIAVSGLCTFAQPGLQVLVHDAFDDSPVPINLILAGLGLVVGLALVVFVAVKAKETREVKSEPGVTEPLLESNRKNLGLEMSQQQGPPPRKYQRLDTDEEIENLEDYEPGGYHPIDLCDVLDGRFEVIYKLGFGGIAMVWLCYEFDAERWRAVKINAASHSSENCAELKILQTMRENNVTPEQLEAMHIVVPVDEMKDLLDAPDFEEVLTVDGEQSVHAPQDAVTGGLRPITENMESLNAMRKKSAEGTNYTCPLEIALAARFWVTLPSSTEQDGQSQSGGSGYRRLPPQEVVLFADLLRA